MQDDLPEATKKPWAKGARLELNFKTPTPGDPKHTLPLCTTSLACVVYPWKVSFRKAAPDGRGGNDVWRIRV
jgi:hypothetical protein